ncbi:MAG: oligosaccharide flippase family protein [Chloroflexi bacterium]|nr:oligosaccharide flippase family protein [Chloroflexota bacterium]
MSTEDIRRRSQQSVAILAVRGGTGKVISIASLVVLANLLTPQTFGAFAVVQFPVSIASLIADAGLSAALVQRGDALTRAEEHTAWSLRLLLGILLAAIVFFVAPGVSTFYDLPPDGMSALRVLGLNPLLDIIGLIPATRLTRALRFDRLAAAEIASLVAGQGTAIVCAWSGLGLWSLILGGLATSITGGMLVSFFVPWRPVFRIRTDAARRLLGFGWRYQAQGGLHVLIARIVPMLGALWFTGTQIGHLVWAQDVARWARIPADYAARVGFPAFSRLREDPAALRDLLGRGLRFTALTSLPAAGLGILLAPYLVEPVFGSAWVAAVPALIVYLLRTPFDALATILLPVIYALGEAGRGLRLSLLWAVLMWAVSLTLMMVWGSLLALPTAFLIVTALMSALIARALPSEVRPW